MSSNPEQWILLGIGLGTILIRMGVRWRLVGLAGWQLDDYLMPLTGAVFAGETAAAHLVGAKFHGLVNSYMTDDERQSLDPASEEYFNRQWGSRIQVLGWSLYAFILWSLKFCAATIYWRLTAGLSQHRLRVKICYAVLGVSYVAVALIILLSCQPMHKFWQIYPNPGPLCQPTNSPAYTLGVVIPNVLTDIYLLSIPVMLLWGVKINLRKRLALIAIFSGALFIMMAAILRAVLILNSGPNGAVEGSSWACRETFVAIIVTNLPVIQPAIRKSLQKIGLSALFSRSGRSISRSYRLHSLQSDNRSKSLSTYPSQETQSYESNEHILSDGRKVHKLESDGDVIMIATEIHVQNEQLPQKSNGSQGHLSEQDWRSWSVASGAVNPR